MVLFLTALKGYNLAQEWNVALVVGRVVTLPEISLQYNRGLLH